MEPYFSTDELVSLQTCEGKILESTRYVFWQNLKQAAGGYEALDWIILGFSEGQRVVLTVDEDNQGIRLDPSFDFQRKEADTLQQFGGQARLVSRSMDNEPVWQDAVGKTLRWVGLQQEADGLYHRKAIRFDFGDWAIDIGLAEEGLQVDVGLE